MAKAFYRIQMYSNKPILKMVNNILEINSKDNDNENVWIYEVVVDENDEYYDFINIFLNILENKYVLLEKIGIRRNQITIWMIYEYDEQCNMEFEAKDLKRLGDNGIKLCVSCYQI